MTNEESIVQELTAHGVSAEAIRITRPRRIFIAVAATDFARIADYARERLAFTILCAITGLDEGASIAILYHFARQDGIMLNIKIAVPKEAPSVASITRHFPGAEVAERELVDLLGVDVQGLGPGKRYPLTDDWPAGEYPLRKDWKPKAAKPQGEARHA